MTPAPPHPPEEPPLPPLGPVFELMRVLWALDHRVRVASARRAARRGLAWPHQLVLRLVGRFPGLTPGELARLLHLHPSSVSGSLAGLGRRGLIQRWPDPRDGRRVRLGLTAAGRALDVPVLDDVEAVVTATLRRLPADRVRVAREVLEALVAALAAAHGD